MNRAWLTVDLEEWYHLDYLKDYPLRDSPVRVIPRIFDFLDMLDDEGVKLIFSEAVDARGVGLAVMNRLGRAAAFRIVKV